MTSLTTEQKAIAEKLYRQKIIGLILKKTRIANGKTHKEIADELGYQHENFLSMIESGRSKIPMARITDFIEVFQLPSVFSLAIMKTYYDETLDILANIVNSAIDKRYNIFKENIDQDMDNSIFWLAHNCKIIDKEGNFLVNVEPYARKKRTNA